MVEYNSALDDVFKALSDPVRREILEALKSGPATVGQIAEPFNMSFAGTAKHVSVLAKAKLVQKRKVGRQQLCSLNASPLKELSTWLDNYAKFWNHHLEALELAIQEFENEKK